MKKNKSIDCLKDLVKVIVQTNKKIYKHFMFLIKYIRKNVLALKLLLQYIKTIKASCMDIEYNPNV